MLTSEKMSANTNNIKSVFIELIAQSLQTTMRLKKL